MKYVDLSIPKEKEKLFIPTHVLEGTKWESVGRQGENWLNISSWYELVSSIVKISDEIAVVNWVVPDLLNGNKYSVYKFSVCDI